MNNKGFTQRRPKRRCKYAKITYEMRLKLLSMINDDGLSVKKASQSLNMKYSTAKHIIANYRRSGELRTLQMIWTNKKTTPEAISDKCSTNDEDSLSLPNMFSVNGLPQTNKTPTFIPDAMVDLKFSQPLKYIDFDQDQIPDWTPYIQSVQGMNAKLELPMPDKYWIQNRKDDFSDSL